MDEIKFEVLNSRNQVVMVTNCEECVPTEDELESMHEGNYKFKINNKIVSLKKAKEFAQKCTIIS